jgi:hypothetical protein
MNGFKTIHFQETDIVRSDFIREYIIAKNAYEREKSQRKIFNGHTVHRTSINTVQLKGKEFVVEHSPVN